MNLHDESPVCRLQFPDGTVPGNNREAAEGWHKAYLESRAEIERLKGIADAYWQQVEEARAERDEWKRAAT